MKNVVFITILFIFAFIFGNSFVLAETNSSMTVQVDLIGFNSSSNDEIGIEVPDSLDLGELSKSSLISDEVGLYINNTGTKDIRVTPILNDPHEEIFKWLFFRTQKTDKDGVMNITHKIGDYYLDIDKPVTGKTYRAGHCYLQLNLTDFSGRIVDDVNNYKTEIVFLATSR
jgi:hypothetical protein